jgi:hypothetical protein
MAFNENCMSRLATILLYLSVLVVLSDLICFGRRHERIGDIFLIDEQVMLDYLGAADGQTSAAINDHLEKGKNLLAAGQLADAITHFHLAIGKTND